MRRASRKGPLGVAAMGKTSGGLRGKGQREEGRGGSEDEVRGMASTSLSPHSSWNSFRSPGYRRIAISKFSKRSQKWRLFAPLGANMH